MKPLTNVSNVALSHFICLVEHACSFLGLAAPTLCLFPLLYPLVLGCGSDAFLTCSFNFACILPALLSIGFTWKNT